MGEATHELRTLPVVVRQPASAAPSRSRGLARRVGRTLLIATTAYYALCVMLLAAFRFLSPPITGVQLQRRVESWMSRQPASQEKRVVPYSRIPQHVVSAVVAAEDGNFWRHSGFDFAEMKDASADLLDGEIPRGASTITQQLMKNLFGSTSRNPVRKLFDMTLTPPAELILGKRRIVELYLNNVEWGPGVFGIDAAARHHYGTGVRGLSRSQAAGLAALLPNPRKRTPETTGQYRAEILRRMAHRGW
jgi:monofunctional glycosyltransferase